MDCFSPTPDNPKLQSLFSQREGFGRSATGGAGGECYQVTSAADSGPGTLREAIESANGPRWIVFAGNMTIDLVTSIRMRPQITVDGRGHNVTILNRGFQIYNASRNIIITNLSMNGQNRDPEEDAVSIANGAHTVWLNRLSLQAYGDGLIDVTNGATDVTISWVRFFNHDKVMIMNSYDESGDVFAQFDRDSKARITLHHSVFYGTTQRHPRIVFGRAHIYNNIFHDWKYYGLSVGLEAQALVENNFFVQESDAMAGSRAFINGDFDKGPYDVTNPSHNYNREYRGYLLSRGNYFRGHARDGQNYRPELVFVPPYSYDLEPVSNDAYAQIMNLAGNTSESRSLHGARSFPMKGVVESNYGVTMVKGRLPGDFTLAETSENSIHQYNLYFDRVGSNHFEISFGLKMPSARALNLYILDSADQNHYAAMTIETNRPNPIVAQWTKGMGKIYSQSAIRNSETGEWKIYLRGGIFNRSTKLRIAFSLHQVQSDANKYLTTFAGASNDRYSITDFRYGTLDSRPNSALGDFYNFWRNSDSKALELTQQALRSSAAPLSNPSVGVTGGTLLSTEPDTVAFAETPTDSPHHGSIYFDRRGSINGFSLSFRAELDPRRILHFYLLKTDNQGGHNISFQFDPITQSVIYKNGVGSGQIYSLNAIQVPNTKEFSFRILGEIGDGSATNIRLLYAYKSRVSPLQPNFVGDPGVKMKISKIDFQSFEPEIKFAQQLMTNVMKEAAGVHGAHAMTTAVYGYAQQQWSMSVEFKPIGSRHLRLHLANHSNSSKALAINCLTTGARIVLPALPEAQQVTASVIPLADGWYRCSMRGVPDPAGGNILRATVTLNNDQTGSYVYTGDGSSGVILRRFFLLGQ